MKRTTVWISVRQYKPKKWEPVLVCRDSDGFVTVASRASDDKFYNCAGVIKGVTHWMDRPLAYGWDEYGKLETHVFTTAMEEA